MRSFVVLGVLLAMFQYTAMASALRGDWEGSGSADLPAYPDPADYQYEYDCQVELSTGIDKSGRSIDVVYARFPLSEKKSAIETDTLAWKGVRITLDEDGAATGERPLARLPKVPTRGHHVSLAAWSEGNRDKEEATLSLNLRVPAGGFHLWERAAEAASLGKGEEIRVGTSRAVYRGKTEQLLRGFVSCIRK